MTMHKYPWYKSIRYKLVLPLVITFVAVWGILTAMIATETRSTADAILNELKGEIVQRIATGINDKLSQAIQINNLHREALRHGTLNFEDLGVMTAYFSSIIKPYNDVAMSYVGLPDGSFYGARRLEDNTIQVVKNNASTQGNSEYYAIDARGQATELKQVFENFDPRKRPWYESALKSREISFTPLYSHFVFKVPTVTASVPIYEGETFVGVFGVDFLMTWLGDILKGLSIGDNGMVFILGEAGNLIATSTQESVFKEVEGKVVNIQALDSENPVIKEAVTLDITQGLFSNMRAEGVEYAVSSDRVTLNNINWTVYTVLDRKDFTGSLDRGLFRITLGFLVASLFFIVMVTRSNRQYAAPILALNESARELALGEFTPVQLTENAPEMLELIQSFNLMGERIVSNVENLKREVQRQTANYEAAAVEAQGANIAKSRFLATMSHELRTPLTGIIGMVDLMNTTALTDEQKDYVNLAEHTAQHLLQLINEVLDYSKIEAQQVVLEQIPFEASDFIQTIKDLARLFVLQKQLAFELHVDPQVPKILVGDQFRLKQVLTNLMGNAVKFTKAGAVSIEIQLIEQRPVERRAALKISVKDTGIGIAPDRIDQLFKPFSQVDISTTREYGGTGLGLAICKELVTLMGGEIGITSTPGQGSVFAFTCWLGYCEAENEDLCDLDKLLVHKKDFAEQTRHLSAKTLLVVEDAKENVALLEGIAAKVQWKLIVARNGQEGLDYYRAHAREIDLVLMDLEMPILDGYQCAEAIRAYEIQNQLERKPIVALSANVLKGEREKAMAADMDNFLQKPYRLDQLLNVVSGLISQTS